MAWAHEMLIQLLDSDLLPVYLDVLQILKSKVRDAFLISLSLSLSLSHTHTHTQSLSHWLTHPPPLLLCPPSLSLQCPVLVEQVVHSSLNLVGGEAFSLLLKRPWNPVVGMSAVDRQVSHVFLIIKAFGSNLI